MVQISLLASFLLGAGASLVAAAPAAAPQVTQAAKLDKRATSCTFTNAASASKSKTSCSTIVLSDIAVPSGTTLDMTDLVSISAEPHVIHVCADTLRFSRPKALL